MEPTEAFYNSEPIAPTTSNLTQEKKLELLGWHPIFTGRCPNCERPIRETVPPRRVHWDYGGCVRGGLGGGYRSEEVLSPNPLGNNFLKTVVQRGVKFTLSVDKYNLKAALG